MTAKEYLRQLWNLDREIEIKYRDLEELRAQIGIKAQPDPNENVGHSGNTSDPVSDIAVRIVQMEKRINKKIDKLISLKQKITAQIDGMENRNSRMILTCRYVLMQNWDDVADSLGYSVQNCYILHGRALQEFQNMYMKH
ncbi:MAG: DUF1492 domain-containing protein [Oscillospiraceae bacterium]|nr:DUF1492 domain-containing protein [Oscillospiraceae bacterium]